MMVGRFLSYLSIVLIVCAGLTSGLTTVRAQSSVMLQSGVVDQYKWRIVGVATLCILEALLIVWLLVNRARRREAQRESERFAELARAEHRRLDEVVSNVPGLVWEIGIDPVSGAHKTRFVSGYVEQLLGYRAEDFLSTTGFGLSLVPEEDRERVKRETDDIFAAGTVGTIQFRWLTRARRLIWVETQLAVIRDEHNKPTGLRGVTMDITDRKLAEESLRQSEERNNAILRAIPDLMFLQSREGTYLDYHAMDPHNLLVPPSEFLGKNMREVLPPELAESFVRCFERAEQTEKPQLLEYSLPIRNEERWFEARIVCSNGDKVLSVVRDVTDRKRAEAGLKDSEAQLGGIVNSAMDAIVSIDERRHVVLFNAAAEQMFGCSAREAIGQPLDRFIPQQFLPSHKDHVRAFGETNVSMGALMPLLGRRGTGEEFPIEASISQVALKGQNFYTVILRDVTRRSQAEKDLRESEERFAKAFRANPQPMSLTTLAEGRYIDVNDSFLKMSGYRREEVIGRNSVELGIWKSPAIRAEFMQQLTAHGIRNVETDFGRKDGSFRVLLSSAELVKIGDEQCVLVASSDITDRKEAEDAVRSAKDELRLIADALPVLISEVDKNGYYRFNNLAYEKWFGQPADQITGHHMREVLGEAVWDRIQPQVARALAGQDVHYEDFLPYRHGEPRWVSVSGIPTRDVAGEVNGFVSLVADITESRRAEEALRHLSGRLINAQEEERSRVARELHDDLSQRMAVLSIGLEQIGQQVTGATNNLQGRIQELQTQAQDVATEIHRLSYQLHPSKLDHLGLASAVKSFCEEVAAHHDLSIEFRQNGFPAPLPQDVTLCVFRIVQESLHNVARHSGARGAQVVLEKTDQEVRLSVSDLGCGFDTNSSKMTSGLGFIGMRERLRLVGGQVSIRSRPFHGTQIEVSVPLAMRAKHASVGSSVQTGDWSSARNGMDEGSQMNKDSPYISGVVD